MKHPRYCEMCETWTSRRECRACGMPTYAADALQDKAEAAHERSLEQYYGGDGPQTVQEQYEQAWRDKYGPGGTHQ